MIIVLSIVLLVNYVLKCNVISQGIIKILIEAAHGYSSAQQARGKYDLGEGITGRAVELERSIVIDKISKSSLFLNKTQYELTKNGEISGTSSVVRIFIAHISYK